MDIVHTTIMLDTRRALKDGTYPVKLRVTFQRVRKYYLTPHAFSEEDYAIVRSDKPKKGFKEPQMALHAIEKKATDVIDKLSSFSFEAFEKKFLSSQAKDDVFSAYSAQIATLNKEGRAGTADSYNCAFKSLSAYTKKTTLAFTAITPEFLRAYELWMVTEGRSLTTVGIYLRTLRAIFNNAIADGEIEVDAYPFGKRKYQIPAGRNIKKALELSDIEKIFDYNPTNDGQARARDLWIFSYLCNGINVKDIARLKYRQLDAETITFIRAKTERTTRGNRKTISAMRTLEIDQILDRWGSKPITPDTYVFPILKIGISPEKELAAVRQATKTINVNIKKIATAVGIKKGISTYTARHSYATVLKRSGAPVEFISEALGHSDLRTTENYLDSFEANVKKQYASHLTAFKKDKDGSKQ